MASLAWGPVPSYADPYSPSGFLDKESLLNKKDLNQLLENYVPLMNADLEILEREFPSEIRDGLAKIDITIDSASLKKLEDALSQCGIRNTTEFFKCGKYQLKSSDSERTILDLTEGIVKLSNPAPSFLIIFYKITKYLYENQTNFDKTTVNNFATTFTLELTRTLQKDPTTLSSILLSSDTTSQLECDPVEILCISFWTVFLLVISFLGQIFGDPEINLIQAILFSLYVAIIAFTGCAFSDDFSCEDLTCFLFGNCSALL